MLKTIEKFRKMFYSSKKERRKECLGQEKTDHEKVEEKLVPKKENKERIIERNKKRTIKLDMREFLKNSLVLLRIIELHLIIYRNLLKDNDVFINLNNFMKDLEPSRRREVFEKVGFFPLFGKKIEHFENEILEIRKKFNSVKESKNKLESNLVRELKKYLKDLNEDLKTMENFLRDFEVKLTVIRKFYNKILNEYERKKEIDDEFLKKLENLFNMT